MSDTVKKISIAGVSNDTRDIGAEAQNIEVSYDVYGDIIPDITAPGVTVDHTASVAEALQDTPPKNHASVTAVYGAASTSQYGHVKLGTGLDTVNGAVVVKYGTSAQTACAGNDTRLSNARKNPQPITFNGDDTNTQYDGSSPQSINYSRVGAAPTNHADSTSKHGLATKNQYGHVKIGDGLENDSNDRLTLSIATNESIGGVKIGDGLEDKNGKLSLSVATNELIGGVKPDGNTILMDEDGTLHGGGAGGSTIEIYTSEPRLYNKEIIIIAEAGSDQVETRFNATGYAIIRGYMGTGSITFTSIDAGEPAEGTINIPYFGNYSIDLSFWSAPITITTSTSEMYGRPIDVKKDGLLVGNTSFNGSGVSSYIAHAPGTYVFECTLGWKTFRSSELTVSAEQDYSAYIQGFVARVILSTSVPEFMGATITVSGSGDVPTSTMTFGPDNTATYMVYERGTYNFGVVYAGESYPFVATVNQERDYPINATLWTAIVDIVTTTGDFFGQTGQIYEHIVGESGESDIFVNNFTFDDEGKATYRIHKAGTYVFSIEDNL